METELFTPGPTAGRYDEHVQALIRDDAKRTPEQIEDGQHASIVVTFPKYQEIKGEKRDAVAKYTRYFQESAKNAGWTGRVVETIDQDDDTVNVRFILIEQQKRPRKAKTDETDTDIPKSIENTETAKVSKAA